MSRHKLEQQIKRLRSQALSVQDEALGLEQASDRMMDLGCRVAAIVEQTINDDCSANGPIRNDEVASLIISAAIGLTLHRCDMPKDWLYKAFNSIAAKYTELDELGMLSPSSSGLSH